MLRVICCRVMQRGQAACVGDQSEMNRLVQERRVFN